MTKPIRWGILGTGGMASALALELAGLPDAQIAAVGSRDAVAAAEFAARPRAGRSYGSYSGVVEDPDVDVVYVATINSTHRDLCLKCLDAGKPVLCEKPFALNAGQARDVVLRARERGLFCMEAMWMRFVPGVVRLKQLVDEGAIGNPRLLVANIGYPFVTNPAGRQFNAAMGGGALLDLGVYLISLAYYLFGQPDSVTGRATLTAAGIDDTATMVLGFPNGRSAVLSASLDTPSPNEAFVAGTHGALRVLSPFFRADCLEYRSAARIEPGSRGSGGLAAAVRKSPWIRGLCRRLEPIGALLPNRAARRLFVPCAGDGYRYEAQEVMRCLQRRPIGKSGHAAGRVGADPGNDGRIAAAVVATISGRMTIEKRVRIGWKPDVRRPA